MNKQRQKCNFQMIDDVAGLSEIYLFPANYLKKSIYLL